MMVQVAATAKATHSQNVIDAVLTTLLQFTRVADPSQPYAHAVVAFGSSALARDATVTLFDIAADYADLMRTGWATCLDCLLRLHKCRLVEPAIFTDAQVRPHVPCPASHTSPSESLAGKSDSRCRAPANAPLQLMRLRSAVLWPIARHGRFMPDSTCNLL